MVPVVATAGTAAMRATAGAEVALLAALPQQHTYALPHVVTAAVTAASASPLLVTSMGSFATMQTSASLSSASTWLEPDNSTEELLSETSSYGSGFSTPLDSHTAGSMLSLHDTGSVADTAKARHLVEALETLSTTMRHTDLTTTGGNTVDSTKRIGSLVFDKVLGEGTTGKVRLATNTFTKEKVAVKCIKKTNLKGKAAERMSREILVLKTLSHPNIARLLDIIETAEDIFIVLEYASGGELFDYIVHHQRVKEKEARRFFRQILSALQYCHANNIIHRDLKPENLLLDSNLNIKIIDFGFANIVKPGKLLDTFCGSPAYAAPEMISGQKYVGPEVDIWSVGVILYALLCGYLPFDDDSHARLFKLITDVTYTFPSFLSDSSKDLIARLLQKNPGERLTIYQVREHPWVNEGYATLVSFVGDPVAPSITPEPTLTDITGNIPISPMATISSSSPSWTPTIPSLLARPLPAEVMSMDLAHPIQQRTQRLHPTRFLDDTQTMLTTSSGLLLSNQGQSQSAGSLRSRRRRAYVDVRSLQTIAEAGSGLELEFRAGSAENLSGTSSHSNLHGNTGNIHSASKPRAHAVGESAEIAHYLANRYRRHSEQLAHPPSLPAGLTPAATRRRKLSSMGAHPLLLSRPGSINLPSVSHGSGSSPSVIFLSQAAHIAAASDPVHPPLPSVTVSTSFRPHGSSLPLSLPSQSSSHATSTTRHTPLTTSMMGPQRSQRRGRSSMGTEEVAILRTFQNLHRHRHTEKASSDTESHVSELRTLRGVYNVETTSTRHPLDVVQEIRRTLKELGVTFVNDPVHFFDCQVQYGSGVLHFEMEVCIVPRVRLTGIHLKRKFGDTWAYKELCQRLVSNMNL